MRIADDPGSELLEGNNVTLWCNAQGYSVANLTSYSWRNSQGDIVSDGKRINITLHNASYSNYYGDFIFNSSLTIFPLLPSDGDQYTCELTLALPRVGVNISNTTVRDIRVAGRTKSKLLRCVTKCNFPLSYSSATTDSCCRLLDYSCSPYCKLYSRVLSRCTTRSCSSGLSWA